MEKLKFIIRKIDFLLPILIAVIILIKVGIDIGGCSIIFAGIIAHFRWKFVYGSEEYRAEVRKNYEISKKQPRQRTPGVAEGILIIILLTAYLLVRNFLSQKYLNVLILLGVELFFLFYFIIELQKKHWDIVIGKRLFILIAFLIFYGISLFVINKHFNLN